MEVFFNENSSITECEIKPHGSLTFTESRIYALIKSQNIKYLSYPLLTAIRIGMNELRKDGITPRFLTNIKLCNTILNHFNQKS